MDMDMDMDMENNNALNVLKSRRCIRIFKDTPVPDEVIKDIVDCGRLAPTGNNAQPWKFVVVTDALTKEKLSQLATWGKFIKDVPLCIVVFCDTAMTPFFVEDGSAATTCIMLAAKAHNLESCWVCGHKAAYQSDVEKLLDAPSGYELISIIPIGYSNAKSNIGKKTLPEVMSYQKF